MFAKMTKTMQSKFIDVLNKSLKKKLHRCKSELLYITFPLSILYLLKRNLFQCVFPNNYI